MPTTGSGNHDDYPGDARGGITMRAKQHARDQRELNQDVQQYEGFR